VSKKNFLYQINFNRDKYPEICEALENAKHGNGIAWYLRELITKDIEEKETKKTVIYNEPKEQKVNSTKIEPKKSDNVDKKLGDTGGFV